MPLRFHPGDRVVYHKQKNSSHPPMRARYVQPARNGDTYSYFVAKFWTVIAVPDENTIVVRTRRNKELRIEANDPALRSARWWERLWFGDRFPNFSTEIGS